jgi:hypothetical protein
VCDFGTQIFVLDGMNLRRSDKLFLALGLVTMFSAFGVFAKNSCTDVLYDG